MVAAGVKGLVDAGISVVPDAYVRLPNGHRSAAIEAEEVPVVDLCGIEEDESKRALVVDVVRRACQEWGFFQVRSQDSLGQIQSAISAASQVTGHGVASELMQSMRELVHYFFNMPAEERMVYYSEDTTKTFRFGTSFKPAVEKTKLWYDYLYHVCNPPPKDEELPNNIPRYREITSDYSKGVNALAKTLLGLFSESLGLERSAVEKRMANPPRQLMRMNYYPPCPNPELAVGIDMHTDAGGFTILQQDDQVEGLEVLHKERWVAVKPLPGAFVINIADQMQLLTNGKYKSVLHRALVNATRTRISIASFYTPVVDTHIAPMVELLDEGGPIYRGCKFGDYLQIYSSHVFTSKTPFDALKI